METVKIRRWGHYIYGQKRYFTPAFNEMLENIDHFLENSIFLKNDETSTVGLCEIDKQQIVIKRANTKGIMHFIRRLFQSSRAQKNYEFAKRLQDAHILTFEPMAIVEERFGWLRGRSYFVCSYLKGIDALHYFAHDATPQPNWPLVAKRIVLLLQSLAKQKLYHQDLNLSNIILIDDKPHLIDLDSMRANRWGWSVKALMRKLRRRFMENWEEAPGVSEDVAPLFQATFNELDGFKS